jgi:hypothetical protein
MEADTLAAALDRWNRRATPPAPAWTSEPPRVAGWYWVEGSRGDIVTIEHVGSYEIGLPWHRNCRWAGPIPEPPA